MGPRFITAAEAIGFDDGTLFEVTADVQFSVEGETAPASVLQTETYVPETDDLDEVLERFNASWSDDLRQKVVDTITPEPRRVAVDVTDFELHEMVDAVGQVLTEVNTPPRYFRSQGQLVRLAEDDLHEPVFRQFNHETLQTELSRRAAWKKTVVRKDGSEDTVIALPPARPVKVVLAEVPAEIPAVHGIVTAPVLRPDGSVLRVGGYDPATKLLYRRPPGMSPVAYDTPRAALLAIWELVKGFPFESRTTDLANYLGYLLTPALRSLLGEVPIPIAYFGAPTQGTGKDLLAGTASTIYYGHAVEARTLPGSEDEIRKELSAILLEGRPLVVYGNVSGTLESDALAGLATSTRWSARKLGQTLDLSFSVRTTFAITGNNLTLGRDFPRRVYRVRLDAKTEHPENRSFDFDPVDYAIEHRNELLGAVLSLCRLWVEAGQPRSDVQWSSYTRWAQVVGGVLEHSGIDGFLENVGTDADPVADDDDELLVMLAMQQHCGLDHWVTAADVASALDRVDDSWPPALCDREGVRIAEPNRALGRWLQIRHGAVRANLRLERRPKPGGRGSDYRVVQVA